MRAGDAVHSVDSSPTRRCRRRYKVGDCGPRSTLALDRLAVQGAVNVVSTWWAGEGHRRRRGRGRRAGTPAQARPRLHPPAPTSSHPLDIPRRQLLRSTRARACARARVTRWAPPRPIDQLLTTYHISTPTCPLSLSCADLITLHQCPFKSALGRLRLPKCRHDKKRPSSGGSRSNTATTDLAQHHYRPTYQHPPTPPAPCPFTTPGIQGQRLGSSPGR
jgi:hypothetical protein